MLIWSRIAQNETMAKDGKAMATCRSRSSKIARGSRTAALALAAILLASCAQTRYDSVPTPGAVSTQPGGPELRLARAARVARDYASAVNLYNTLLQVNPHDAAVIVELGDTLLEAGAVDDAIDAYNRVDSGSPAWLGAALGLGRARIALHDPGAALALFEAAAKIAPQDTRVLIGQGVALDLLERHDEAQARYRAVLAVNPGHVAARNDLALSLALSGQFGEAIEIMSHLARSSEATPTIRQNLALIYGLEGDMNQAAAASAQDLAPADVEANMRLFGALSGSP